MQYPDILDVIDAYVTIKGGKKSKGPQRDRSDRWIPEAIPEEVQVRRSLIEQQFASMSVARENRQAQRDAKPLSVLPEFAQQAFKEWRGKKTAEKK